MRKFFFILLATALLVSVSVCPTTAGDDERTGTVDDNKYVDHRFGFSVQLPESWKVAKPKDEPHPQRLIAEEKHPRVPIKLQENPGAATKPTLIVFADSTDMTPQEFMNFLRADTTESDFKEKLLDRTILLDAFSKYNTDILSTTTVEFLGRQATRMVARLQYEAVGYMRGRNEEIKVNDFRVGYIYLVPMDGWLMYVEFACENQFAEALEESFGEILDSFTWVTEASDSTKTEEG
jgi:hypothetical protein